MANTHKPSIFGRLIPDSSGLVTPVPLADVSSNTPRKYMPLVFADSATRNGAEGTFPVPENYSAATTDPKFVVRWTSTITEGEVEWDGDYLTVAVGESLDQAGEDESVNVADVAPASAQDMLEAELVLDRTNIAPGDQLQFGLFRDGTDVGDTMASGAIVHDVLFVYDDG